MDEEKRITGYQVENYFDRRITRIRNQSATLSKEWRDWLIQECTLICERMYVVKMRDFLNVGEQDVDLSQEAFEKVKLTTIRFDPNKIPYVPVKMKRKVDKVYADLNDDIYHTKKFARFIREVLILKRGVRQLKKHFGDNYDAYLLGLKEWLRRQFLSAYQKYIIWSYSENQARQNKARADMGAYSTEISEAQFNSGEANSAWSGFQDDETTTERLEAITRLVGNKLENKSLTGRNAELMALMIDKYSGSTKGENKREVTLIKNFRKRRLTEVIKKYGLTEKEALTQENAQKYRLTEKMLENDYRNLTYIAEDIFTELKEDY